MGNPLDEARGMDGEEKSSEDPTYHQEAKRDSISQDLTTDNHGLKHRLHASTTCRARIWLLLVCLSRNH